LDAVSKTRARLVLNEILWLNKTIKNTFCNISRLIIIVWF